MAGTPAIPPYPIGPNDGGVGRRLGQRPYRGSRSWLWGFFAGLALMVGGYVLLAYGPAAAYPGPLTLVAYAEMLTGVLVIVIPLASSGARNRGRPYGGTRRAGNAGLAALGLASAVVGLVALAWIGVIPGQYLGSPGGESLRITGCESLPGASFAPTFPYGFPPGSHVSFRWQTQSSTKVWLNLSQTAEDSSSNSWAYEATGTAGSLTFTGTGGLFWIASDAAEPCSTPELLNLTWDYTTVL